WEIVRGKLLAQVIQLGTLALAALPVFAFFGAFAGMTLVALAVLVWTVLVQLVALSAVSLLASVWCRRTTTAVVSVYFVGGAVFALLWYLDRDAYFRPLYLLEPAWLDPVPGELGGRLLASALSWGGVIAACLG